MMAELSLRKGNDSNGHSNARLTCFICVQPVAEEDGDSVWYPLCGILNRLKIKPTTTTLNEDEYDSSADLVPLCEKCSKVVSKLSDLCLDLETVKMKINYYLTQLDQLIVLEESSQENGSLHIMIDEDSDSGQLKRRLKDKCSKVMKEGPTVRVVLSKVDQATEQEMEIEDDLIPSNQIVKWDINYGYDDDDDEYKQTEEKATFTLIDDQSDEYGSDFQEELEPELQNEYVMIIEDSSTNTPVVTQTGNSSAKRKRNPKTKCCTECDISYATKSKLDEHFMILHPERYFPPPPSVTTITTPALSNKAKAITPNHHKMYLTHLLNTEVDYCKNPKLDAYKCIYCGKLFQNLTKRISMLTHLINTHHKFLQRELTQLKKEKSTEEIESIVKLPSFQDQKASSVTLDDKNCKLKHFRADIQKMRKEYTCNTCGVRTTAPRMHQVVYHPDKLLIKFKKSSGDMSQNIFKMYCVYLISKVVSKFSELEISGGKVKVRCPHCPKLYAHGMACRNHVILGHVEILGEELVRLQGNVGVEDIERRVEEKGLEIEVPKGRCKVCDVLLTKATVLKHVKRAHPKEYLRDFVHYDCVNCGEPYGSVVGLRDHSCRKGWRLGGKGAEVENICKVCGRRFERLGELNLHYSKEHVEEVFGGMRGEGMDREGFKRVCEEVMEEEKRGLEVMFGEDYKVKWRCGYCGEEFKTKKLGWAHLVGKHKGILEGKVRGRVKEVEKRREGEGKGCGVRSGDGVGGKVETVTTWQQFYDVVEDRMEVESGGVLEGGRVMEGDGVEVKEENYLDGDSMYSY